MSMLAPSLKAQEWEGISKETKKIQHELVDTLNNDKSSSNDVISFDDAIVMKIEEWIDSLKGQEKKDIKKLIKYYWKEEFDNRMSNVVKDIINNPDIYWRYDKDWNYSMVDKDWNLYEQKNLEELIESRFDRYYIRKHNLSNIGLLCSLLCIISSSRLLIKSKNK